MKESELLSLKQEIEDASKEVAKSQGKKEALLAQLKSLGYKSLDEAKKGLEKLEAKEEKLQNDIDIAISEIEEKYEKATN